MNNKDFVIFGVVVLAIVALLYVLFPLATSGKADVAKALFFKSLDVGKDSVNYVYAYQEDNGALLTQTKIVKSGKNSLVNIITPLSEKTIYFTSNDTILCIKYKSQYTCASVKNETAVQPYLASVKGFFIDKTKTDYQLSTLNFLVEKGALIFGKDINEKEVNGKKCSEITYDLRYSQLSIADASTLGMKSVSPENDISAVVCVNQETGQWYEKTFKTASGFTISSKLLKADWTKGEAISLPLQPDNETIYWFMNEKNVEAEVLKCFGKTASERDKCIYNNAVWEEMPELCKVAGEKKDVCYFDSAIKNTDDLTCKLSGSLEQDCYLELAWQNKNTEFCDSITDATKKDFCIKKAEEAIANANTSVVNEPEPEPKVAEPDKPINQTEEDLIDNIFESIDGS